MAKIKKKTKQKARAILNIILIVVMLAGILLPDFGSHKSLIKMFNKNTPIFELKGIGPRSLLLYENLGYTLLKILFHIPFRYQDTSEIISIKSSKRGEGTFLAEIEDVNHIF